MTLSLLRRAAATVITCAFLAGCAPSTEPAAPEQTQDTPSSSAAAAPNDGLPVTALPALTREGAEACPYLDGQWLADTNGQRLTEHSVDHTFQTPACVFYSYPPEPQAVVMVRHLPDAEAAYNVVDWAAPIDATSPAETSPSSDWTGGRGMLPAGTYQDPAFTPGMYPGTTYNGSVYAVSKDNVAVVVWINQEQTVKAEAIAHEAITNLGL